MEAHEEELGPVDIVVIGYPADAPMTGEAVPLLLDLVDNGIIRVLDVLFVIKNEDGTFSGLEAKNLDSETVGDLVAFEGASSGLLGEEDAATAADAIEPGTAAVHDRLREPLGGAVCCRCASQRRRAASVRARPRPGPDRLTRRCRGSGLTERITDARIASRCRPHRCNSRYGDRGLEPREPPSSPEAGPGRTPTSSSSSTPSRHRRRPLPARAAWSKLKELGELKESGVLTEEEFAAEKARILQS